MSVLAQQFEAVRARYVGATMRALPSGAHLVAVPGVTLPEGWNARSTAVRFVAPVGFPFAQPDCFWTDDGLRLANGAMPQNTGMNPIPEVAEPGLWFSWHLARGWNPNTDSLSSWLASIVERLCPAR